MRLKEVYSAYTLRDRSRGGYNFRAGVARHTDQMAVGHSKAITRLRTVQFSRIHMFYTHYHLGTEYDPS